MLNRCEFIGNLGRDPELRHTQGGVAVCNLNVAVNSRVKRNGEWEDQTEWVRAVVFARRAEVAEQYLSKGSKVYMAGRLQTREYEDKEGVRRWSSEVILDDLIFLDGKKQGGADDERPAMAEYSGKGRSRNKPDPQEDMGFQDDDLPF